MQMWMAKSVQNIKRVTDDTANEKFSVYVGFQYQVFFFHGPHPM